MPAGASFQEKRENLWHRGPLWPHEGPVHTHGTHSTHSTHSTHWDRLSSPGHRHGQQALHMRPPGRGRSTRMKDEGSKTLGMRFRNADTSRIRRTPAVHGEADATPASIPINTHQYTSWAVCPMRHGPVSESPSHQLRASTQDPQRGFSSDRGAAVDLSPFLSCVGCCIL